MRVETTLPVEGFCALVTNVGSNCFMDAFNMVSQVSGAIVLFAAGCAFALDVALIVVDSGVGIFMS